MCKNRSCLIVLGLLMFNCSAVNAEATIVAVAANFTKPMTEIAVEFEKTTGHTVKLAFGSSGKFVAQIENGAPYEVFLSADETGPVKLEQAGLSVPDTRFVYAIGRLVLWSAVPGLVDEQGKVLSSSGFKHLAIADPKLAPYGVAAIEVLGKQGLADKLKPLLVLGENITQAYQFVSTGNAELGFIALSQVFEQGKIASGSAWIVPFDQYSALTQSAVLLNLGSENPAAKALMAYLKSDAARNIIKKYGYNLP